MKNKIIFLIPFLIFPFISRGWTILQNTGGKATGMGGAFISRNDATAILNNQAGLVDISKLTIGINYENRFLANTFSERSVYAIFPLAKAGTLSGIYQATGASTWSQSKSSLSYSRRFGEKFSASLTFDFMTDKEPEDNILLTTAGFEAGFIYETSPKHSIGVHVSNLHSPKFNSGLSISAVPWKIRAGGHYKAMDQLILAYEIEKMQSAATNIKAGIEYQAVENFILRGGYATFRSAFSLGIGFNIFGIDTDLGFKYNQYLGFTPSLSLAYSL